MSLLALCASCGDADLFDTDKWSDQIDGWEPGVKAKIAQGTFTLWDLVNQGDDDVIVKEGNDLVIQYTEKDIYKIEVGDIFYMPKQSITLSLSQRISPDKLPDELLNIALPEALTVNDITGPSQKVEDIPRGCELKKLVASASLVLPSLSWLPNGYDVTIESPDIRMNGEMFQIECSVKPGEDYNMLLDNMEFSLTPGDEEITLEIKELKIPAGSLLTDRVLELEVSLKDLRFKQVEGKIVVPPLEIERNSFDMNVDFLNEIGGKFTFTKPELNVVLHNKGVGVPLNIVPVFEGSNGEQSINLTLKEEKRLYTAGNTSNVLADDTLGLNAENSNIVDFISLPPQGKIFYEGTVQINPDDADDNVVYSDAEVSLDAYVRIPFALSAENLSYKDTLTDIDVDAKYAEKIQEGVIEILTDKNELGLKLQVSALILVDEAGNKLTTITAVKGKEWLEEGKSIEFKINHEQAVKLGQTDQILLEVVASTGEENGVPKEVVIEADAQLNFSLMLTVKTKIENLNDF